MTPDIVLKAMLLALAFVGYVACLRRFLWITLAVSGGVAAYAWHALPYAPDDLGVWIVAGLAAAVALRVAVPQRANDSKASPPPLRKNGPDVAIDGTNVMYWDGEADLRSLRLVVDLLRAKGMHPFVFLDASSRHHLKRPELDEAGFAKALGLKRNRVMVCPAGTEADAFILKFAKDEGMAVVSNDRFGDRAQQAKGIKLIKGGIANDKPMLHGL